MARRVATEHIVVHCTATTPSQDIGFAEVDHWHKSRGWSGCGYAIIIRRNGKVEFGRGMDDIGAHVKGYNSRSIGIALVGGVSETHEPENNFTQKQFISLGRVIDFVQWLYPKAVLVGHRDLSPDQDGDGVISSWEFVKACPSFDVQEIFNG